MAVQGRVGGAARAVGSLYARVDGASRQIREGYARINGVSRRFYSSTVTGTLTGSVYREQAGTSIGTGAASVAADASPFTYLQAVGAMRLYGNWGSGYWPVGKLTINVGGVAVWAKEGTHNGLWDHSPHGSNYRDVLLYFDTGKLNVAARSGAVTAAISITIQNASGQDGHYATWALNSPVFTLSN